MTTPHLTVRAAAALSLAGVLAGGLGGCGGASMSSSGSEARGAAPASAPASANPSARLATGDRQLVRKGTLEIEVNDLTAAASKVTAAATSHEGVVAGEELRDSPSSGDSATDRLTVRVPVASFDAAMTAIASAGTVTNRSVSSEDVTAAVADTGARVKTMQASLDRTRALMARATTIADITALERELTRRQSDLEALQAQLATLRSTAAMSTIDVNLTRHGSGSGPAAGDSPFVAGLKTGLAALRGLTAVVGFVLPLLVPLAIVAVPLVLIVRHRRARRRALLDASMTRHVPMQTTHPTSAPIARLGGGDGAERPGEQETPMPPR